MGIDICGDYWKIAKKATDALEAEFEKLKAAKTSEIKKELLFDFIEMHKKYLCIYTVRIAERKGEGYQNRIRKMHYISNNLFYYSIIRSLYFGIVREYMCNPVPVSDFKLFDDKTIDRILKSIEQFKNEL